MSNCVIIRCFLRGVSVCLLTGCVLKEIRGKNKSGPECRHRGIIRKDDIRWTAQQGFELKWDNRTRTGITYRRRDVENGDGSHDDGVWLEKSYPLWKTPPRPDAKTRRLEALEERLARKSREIEDLEQRLAQGEQRRIGGEKWRGNARNSGWRSH